MIISPLPTAYLHLQGRRIAVNAVIEDWDIHLCVVNLLQYMVPDEF